MAGAGGHGRWASFARGGRRERGRKESRERTAAEAKKKRPTPVSFVSGGIRGVAGGEEGEGDEGDEDQGQGDRGGGHEVGAGAGGDYSEVAMR